MSRPRNLRRRKFLQLTASAAASAATVSCTAQKSPWRFFTREEGTTLAAICERVIPTDREPGAAWAGAVNFIDRHLLGHFKRLKQTYRRGLASLDQTSLALYQKRFVELASQQQIGILETLENNRAPREIWTQVPAREFFDLVITHTMQSFYGDPRHGGNREAVSWRMLGIPLVPVRGRDQYDLSKPGTPTQYAGREK